MQQNNKAVLALSGGVDSATTAVYFLKQNFKLHCIFFNYASKHNIYEARSANKLINYFSKKFPNQITNSSIDANTIFQNFKSNLLQNQGEIPEGHYTDKTMSQTVVPARNIIFLSIMAGVAKSNDANTIALGIHQGDHAIYADCRTEFYKAMDSAIFLGTNRQVEINAPFINYDKTNIIKWGIEHSVPYELTRTCYKNQELSCGKCGSCCERLEAFHKINKKDPIPYEIPLGAM